MDQRKKPLYIRGLASEILEEKIIHLLHGEQCIFIKSWDMVEWELMQWARYEYV
jgi:hypothetical protein